MTDQAGHNQGRALMIKEIVALLEDIEADKEAIAARLKRAKGKIKSELGMKVADFMFMRRLSSIEEDDRESFFDSLREGFEALGIGMQHSFLSAFDPSPLGSVAGHADARPKTKFDAENLGYLAGKEGSSEDVMPVMTAKKGLQTAWLTGHAKGKAEREAEHQAKRDADFDSFDKIDAASASLQ